LPTYEYRCLACEHQFERFQRMSDDPVKECEVCGAAVKRLLFPVAIHFKGKGFYSTDYSKRSALGSSGASTGNGNGDGNGSEKSSESGGSGGNDAAKPASSSSSESSGSSESKGSSGSSDSGSSTPVSATTKND
jgi:putative FmdB family regulatory protein